MNCIICGKPIVSGKMVWLADAPAHAPECPREPTMLELRGALSLLRDGRDKLSGNNHMTEGREGSLPKEERSRQHKAYNDASHILSMAAYEVSAQLRAVLGQNKEYTQAAALLGVK